jgi:hypothetical protein
MLRQFVGGASGGPGRQMYQSRHGPSRDARDAVNHGWRSEVW